MGKINRHALRSRVDELLGDGIELKDACMQVAVEEKIVDRTRLSAAAFVERQWASDQEPSAPSRVRAGRRGRRFVPGI